MLHALPKPRQILSHKRPAFSLIELLVVLGIVGAFFAFLPQLIPVFNPHADDTARWVEFVQKGRAEALNRRSPVVLAYTMVGATPTWTLWETSDEPAKLDTFVISSKSDTFVAAKSKASASATLGELATVNLGGVLRDYWQFPTSSATPSEGGVIFWAGTSYLFNALGNVVAN